MPRRESSACVQIVWQLAFDGDRFLLVRNCFHWVHEPCAGRADDFSARIRAVRSRIFTERLPDLASSHARKTKRLNVVMAAMARRAVERKAHAWQNESAFKPVLIRCSGKFVRRRLYLR